ncbi:MAG: diiron oxygenase [Betaproteobacteria bacterium]|nr:diiron oxygenase [Betaproteobacteria bacterium]
MAHAESLLRQLAANSTPYRDPLAVIDWGALDTAHYWLPPAALSLAGVPEFEALPETARVRTSQYEFLGVLQAALWLERIFMERVTRGLRSTASRSEYAYLLHELREEAGHSLMFLELVERSGLPLPEFPGFSPSRLGEWLGRHGRRAGPLFWLAVVIGEEVPDKLNRVLRLSPPSTINPVVRQMCALHVTDEARHIAYARSALEASIAAAGPGARFWLRPLINFLFGVFVEAFYFPRPGLYELAGLAPGRLWRRRARANPRRMEFIRQCVAPTRRLLESHGFPIRLGGE